MRRFTIAVGSGGGEIDPWLDTGFIEFAAGKEEDGRLRRPDVLIISPAQAGWEGVAVDNWPKVIFFTAKTLSVLPAELAEDYRLHRWRQAGISLTLATRLEAPLVEPEWAAYLQEDRLAPPLAAKAAAGSVYRHLLADLFRDTAEWCGHTFSVVITV